MFAFASSFHNKKRSMIKNICLSRLAATMISLSAFFMAAPAQAPLFSNYGYRNLSYDSGVANTIAVQRVETAIDGDVIHLVWIDEKTDNITRVWYRRSNDLGLSWEKPMEVIALSGANSIDRRMKIMSAANGRVHIVVADGNDLVCLTSSNGKEFSRQVLDTETSSYGHCATFIQAVDNKVAICYQSSYNDRKGVHIAYSTDSGANFTDSLITCKYEGEIYSTELYSFSFDGKTMAALTFWSDRWSSNPMFWVTSSTDGKQFNSTQIATELTKGDGTKYHGARSPWGDNAANEPYQNIAISGDRFYVVTNEQFTDADDKIYLVLHQSTDGGKTWMEPKQICAEEFKPENKNVYIKAGGDDVYILTECGGYGQYEIRNLIFHSHDSGATFDCQTDWTETIHNRGHISDYTLCFDPSDKTGKTIYLAGNDYSWVKTTDGFTTVDEVSLNDNSCPDFVGFWGNLFTNLEIDRNGVRHWFIRYKPNDAKRHEVIYRREAGEPAPGVGNKTFEVAPQKAEGYVRNRVVIPNNRSFHSTAMTIEMWVKTDDSENDQYFAYLSHEPDQSVGYGFYFGKDEFYGSNKFIAGLCNDKDDRVSLKRNSDLEPGKWYHLALTYDEDAHTVCFYVNGVLAEEKEFHGAIGWGWNPIIIGNPTRQKSNGSYFVDDFRLWNRALSVGEIQAGLHKQITTAEGLMVNIGFDDTLLDLSGNGNDGYGMADVDFKDQDINVPTADFDICQTETGEVVLSNHSVETDTYLWSFGDGKTSALAQPTHTYNKVGEYTISLEAGNATTYASAAKTVIVAGLSDIQPRRIGNAGKMLATITGGGIKASQKIVLTRGGAEIKATDVWEEKPGILKAWFEVEGAELGRWTLKVGSETLENAVTIEEVQEAKPWMTFQGRGKILLNKWLTHTISYGNKGNVDAYNVPLNFLISHYPDLEVEFIDFHYELPKMTAELFPADSIPIIEETLKKDIGDYVVVKDDNGKEWRYYPFQVPIIKAGSSQDIHLRLKTSQDIQIQYWSDESWGQLDEEAEIKAIRKYIANGKKGAPSSAAQAECLINNIGMGAVDAVIDIIPFGGCVWGSAKTVYGVCTDDSKDRLYNLAWNLGTTSLSCLTGGLSSLGKIGYIAATSISMGASGFGALAGGARCTGGPPSGGLLRAVTSWDPNEMIGPSQFMDKDSVHWIASDKNLPYKILFENKKEATAPAHTVFVSDTLDTAKMNLDDFAFSSVGWGDTIINVPGEQRAEFSMDIDMRPTKPYLVRTSGKLNKETGVVNWLFVTLNPETLDEEEDPEIGFLPPNDDSHVGEGFVSFIVGQKEGLATGTKIKNMASIIFDANKPILTNNFVNGIDTDIPLSAAYLVSEYDKEHLKVQWSGDDASSGVAWYDVYVSLDDEIYLPVKEKFDGESMLVEKLPDTKYYFYTVVTDNVGLSETKDGTYDVMYDPATSINTLKTGLALTKNGEKAYEVLLPVEACHASMKVFGSDGRELQSQDLGRGNRFYISIQTPGVSLLLIEADGQQYVWKIASK